MIAFELLVRPAISAGVSVTLQDDAADDMPVVGRKPLPVKRPHAHEAFGNAGLHRTQQREHGGFHNLPFRFRQTCDLRQACIADGTAHPCLQQQQPQRAMLMRGQVERVGKVIADIEMSMRLVQGSNGCAPSIQGTQIYWIFVGTPALMVWRLTAPWIVTGFQASSRLLMPRTIGQMRRFPSPWSVEKLDGGFKIVDANKEAVAWVYGHADQRDAEIAKGLTLDEV